MGEFLTLLTGRKGLVNLRTEGLDLTVKEYNFTSLTLLLL